MKIKTGWTGEILLALMILAYLGLGWLASRDAGAASHFHPIMYLDSAAFFGYVLAKLYLFVFALRLFILAVHRKPPNLRAFFWDELKAGPLNRERWLRAIPVFATMIVMLSVFTSLKILMPIQHPFAWDERLLALDRHLHFGIDPWRILDPLFGRPLPTFAINLIYNIWLPLLFIVLYWQLFSLRAPRVRMQFFIAFVLTWAIAGSLLAAVFSSAGPCFLERLNGNAHFAPLMDRLAGANAHFDIMALRTQDGLWQSYEANRAALGGGISAMPSVHVATALLYLLLALRLKSPWWPLAALFLAAIMIGSVHLGWHYAADGYAAIAVTLPLWFLAGRLSEPVGEALEGQALHEDGEQHDRIGHG